MMTQNELNALSNDGRKDYDYPTRAVILAAGRGIRLNPYTKNLPKPLLAVDDRPLLDYILCALEKARVTHACIVVHYLAEQIRTYVGHGERWHMEVEFKMQEHILGTANALYAASEYLSEPCFVLAADYALSENSLLDLKRSYQSRSVPLFASLKVVPREELSQRSAVILDEVGHIRQIIEKPQIEHMAPNIGASLIYVVPNVITRFLKQPPRSDHGEYELADVLNMMISDGYLMEGLLQPAPREWTPDSDDGLSASI
jgi:NDP-sugar pyrophosphorylase family protein